MKLSLTLTYTKQQRFRDDTFLLCDASGRLLSTEAVVQDLREQLEAILNNPRIDEGKQVTITIVAGE